MKNLIIILITVLIIGGGAYYLYTNRSADEGSMEGQGTMMDDEDTMMDKPGMMKSSIYDLVNLNSQQCAYTFSKDGISSNGIVYISNNKQFYGEFETADENGTYNSRMLYMPDHVYIWDPDTNEGFKMPNKEADLSGMDFNEYESTPQIDYSANYDFDCSHWGVDNSKLTPPSDVTFSDIGSMMNDAGMPENIEGMMEDDAVPSGDVCAACDQVPQEDRASCLAALGC